MQQTWMTDDKTTINFEIFGDRLNPPLLLLPGLMGSISTQWRKFVRPLTTDYRVLMMDLRGHGRSNNSQTTLRPDRMAKDIAGSSGHSRTACGWI